MDAISQTTFSWMQKVWIPIEISLKFVPKDLINNIPALVQIMGWRRPGNKPLSESMMVSLLTHVCVTWPQWVNSVSTIPIHIGGCLFGQHCACRWLSTSHLQTQYWPHRRRHDFVKILLIINYFDQRIFLYSFFFKSCKLFSTTRLKSLPFLITYCDSGTKSYHYRAHMAIYGRPWWRLHICNYHINCFSIITVIR